MRAPFASRSSGRERERARLLAGRGARGGELVSVLVGPRAEVVEEAGELSAERREAVLDAHRRLGVDEAGDEAVALEPAQVRGEDLLRDPRNVVREPGVPADAARDQEHDVDGPLGLEQGEGCAGGRDQLEVLEACPCALGTKAAGRRLLRLKVRHAAPLGGGAVTGATLRREGLGANGADRNPRSWAARVSGW